MSKKIQRFEDFIAWQKARKLTADVYRVTSEGKFARDFGLKDQIRRAAVSSMSNLAEGFERGRPSEFHQFLSIAKGSCAAGSNLRGSYDASYRGRTNPRWLAAFSRAETRRRSPLSTTFH